MHVILRTISSFFPHQKILFLSKVMPLKICDTSPGFSISILMCCGKTDIECACGMFLCIPIIDLAKKFKTVRLVVYGYLVRKN